MDPKLISRVDGEDYIQTVARAMDTQAVRQSGSDYHRLDYSEVLTVANTEHTPLARRISRREASRDIKHFWLEQYIPGAGTVTPLAETADPAENTAFVPTRYENNMMKLGRRFVITDEMNVIARAGGLIAVGTDEWGRQMGIQLNMTVRDLEVAILESQLSDASPRAFRGLLGNYKNGVRNGWIGTAGDGGIITNTSTDLAGVQITTTNVEQIFSDAMLKFYLLNAGPMPNVAYVNPRLLKVVKDAAASKVVINMNQSEVATGNMNLGGSAGLIATNFGNLPVLPHQLLPAALVGDSSGVKATSTILFLYEPGLSLIDYIGAGGVHVEPRAKTAPTEDRIIYQWVSLELRYLKSHGAAYNFSV